MIALLQLDRKPKLGRIRRGSKELAPSVVSWFRSNRRDFPWRDTKNPFRILIAEVLLRQTQANRVVGPYFHPVTTYPDPASRAEPDVDGLRQMRTAGVAKLGQSKVSRIYTAELDDFVQYVRSLDIRSASVEARKNRGLLGITDVNKLGWSRSIA